MNPQQASDAHDSIAAPGWIAMAMEARAPVEYVAGVLAMPLLAQSPRGDGHAVLVLPGMLASDQSTEPLRRLLCRLGYDAHGWGQGCNLGPGPAVLGACLDRICELQRRDGRTVSLIGQSLGGIYARELAKRATRSVRCVITLGTPFTGGRKSTNAWQLFESLNGQGHNVPSARAALREPPPVPTTSIYSRSDGIVAWPCSVQASSPMTENIEVDSSHSGMGVNPLVLHAIADRLAQAEGHWKPFARTGWRRRAFRAPETTAQGWPGPASS